MYRFFKKKKLPASAIGLPSSLKIFYSGNTYFCTMFTREEASRIKEEFWTSFGKYMRPVLSAEGLEINWVNYHTGIKDVHFRMDAGRNSGVIFISLEHRDAGIRELFFEQFQEL